MDTLRSFESCGDKGVYRQMSCRGITRDSAVLYRLLKQTIEASKKRNMTVRVTNIKKKKRKWTIVRKLEIKLQFPYVDPTQHEHRTAVYVHLQYHCA